MSTSQAIPLYPFPYAGDHAFPFRINYLDPADSSEWDSDPDRHAFYALFWFESGRGTHHIDFEPYPLRPNTLFLLRPGRVHFFDIQTPVSGYALFFPDEFIAPLTNADVVPLFYTTDLYPVVTPRPAETTHFKQLIHWIYAEYSRPARGQLNAIQHLMQLLFIAIERAHRLPTTSAGFSTLHPLTTRFQLLIDQEFHREHQLQAYAARLGVTPDHLSQVVKDSLGVTAASLIRQRIMVEARRLLAHTDYTATQIGHLVGFDDSAYFGRFFKRESGQTPITFRKTFREKYQNIRRKSLSS